MYVCGHMVSNETVKLFRTAIEDIRLYSNVGYF